MATIGRSKAIAWIGRFKLGGVLAWVVWLMVHLMALVGFRNRVIVMFEWAWSYLTWNRGNRVIHRAFGPLESPAEPSSAPSLDTKP